MDTAFVKADEVEERFGIDLVTAETIRAGLVEVTRHMHRTLQRSGFSNVVRDNLDFGVCLHLAGRQGTEMVAITEGCTHFAYTHPAMANFVVDEWGLENFGPGDTVICNDPWRGSIHLPDLNLFRPVFWGGEVLFLLSDASHLIDIGGPVAGGFNTRAQDFFHEGLRIPPMLITSADKPVRSTMNLILENTRAPMHNLGDVRALFGTMKVGETRLVRLLETYGGEAVVAAAEYTLDLAERRMRAAIARVPDGTYEADEWIDDDGVGSEPVHLHLTGRVSGSHIELDFTGTDRQPTGSVTTCWEETGRTLIGAKMLLDPRHPMNGGAIRPFHVTAPVGSAVMGTPPTSNSNHADLATKVATLSLQLFGQMVPGRAVGADGGNTHSYVFGGIDKRPGREGQPFGGVVSLGLGWGGTPNRDGLSFCTSPIFGISAFTVELMERDFPVIIRSLNGQIDSAGAGRHRAGYANTLVVEPAQDELGFTTLFDSARFTRPGAHGGGEGMTSYVFRIVKDPDGTIPMLHGLIPMENLVRLVGRFDDSGLPDPANGVWGRGAEFTTAKLLDVRLPQGEALFVVSAAGGGYGDPLDRDPALVRLDVWNEKLSLRVAEEVYGVVITAASLKVDAPATEALRSQLRADRARGTPVPVSGVRPWPMNKAELALVSGVLIGGAGAIRQAGMR
jgi:N-methylhydantoinase B